MESSVLQSGRYDMPDLIRDLTKSAVATRKPESMGRGQKVPIATSHWGFDHLLNTNTKMLRAVVQMLAASEVASRTSHMILMAFTASLPLFRIT